MIDYAGTTVLITGASSGLGVVFAHRLSARGAHVVLIARRADRLEEIAAEIRSEGGTATVVPHDLAAPGAAAALVDELDARGLRIDSLVNNAGFGMKGDLLDADAARLDEMVQLNVAAVTSLTRRLLPALTASGRGVLVNVASTAAYQPLPSMAAYGASKAYVLSFTEAIAHETLSSGLRVLALSPGATRTEFFDVVGSDDAAVGVFQTADEVVTTALETLDRRRPPYSVVSGRRNAVTAALASLMPRKARVHVAARALGA